TGAPRVYPQYGREERQDSRILLPSSNPPLVTNDFVAVASTSSKIQGMDSYHSVRDVRFNQQRVGQTRNDRVPREKLFACTYCGKVFNRPKKVVIHQRIHTGEKPFKCNTCGKFFAEAGNLRKHQKVHTGERPYVCKYCGKAFPGLSNVVAHQRVHTGERPFKCDTCGKLFTEAGNLKKHQRVHTGEKPFICPRCGKRFAWICNLKTHQQSACCGGGRGFEPHVGRKCFVAHFFVKYMLFFRE
uniref:C2H2-type domain-containing protein n=1 Tax=Cyprinus carpio TaxID=7962 RepID=A0A8C2JUF9_CYPCA